MKKRKRTALQTAYQKERRRLQQAIYRGKKQGYIFPEDLVPKMPKRVTKKSLEKIRAIKPISLYEKAEYLYKETGEVVPAKDRKAEVKQKAIAKAKITRELKKKSITLYEDYFPEEITQEFEGYIPTISVIDRVRSEIINLTRDTYPKIPIDSRKNALLEIFEDTLNSYENPEEFEQYLIQHQSEIAELLYKIEYDSKAEDVELSFASLGRLLNMKSLSPTQAEGLSLMSEYNAY